MLGLEVLTWGTGDAKSNPYTIPFQKYLLGGCVGHCAIKLTLPATLEMNALIKEYCFTDKNEELIPHYPTTIWVKESRVDPVTREIKYNAKAQQAWVLYFSWWPNGLAEEYDDLRSANCDKGPAVDEKEIEEIKLKNPDAEFTDLDGGKLRHWLGPRVSSWILGKPKKMLEPIATIVHPHPQAKELTHRLSVLREEMTERQAQLLSLLEKAEELEEQMFILELQHRKPSETFIKEATKFSIESEKIQKKFYLKKKELVNFSRFYCSQIATMGYRPDHCHYFPFQDINGCEIGLNLKPILSKMFEIATGQENYDIFFFNCAHVARTVLMAGLPKNKQEQYAAQGLMDFTLPYVDTPQSLKVLASSLQTALCHERMELSKATFTPQYSPYSTPKKALPENPKESRTPLASRLKIA